MDKLPNPSRRSVLKSSSAALAFSGINIVSSNPMVEIPLAKRKGDVVRSKEVSEKWYHHMKKRTIPSGGSRIGILELVVWPVSESPIQMNILKIIGS